MVNKNFVVGLFVLAGLSLFTVGLFLIGNRHEAFAKHVEFYADFTNLAGLSKGSKVQVAGMDAGQVLDIGVPSSPSSGFRVKVRIDDRLHGLVRTDSIVSIGTEGVVGNTFLLIHPGSSQAPAAASLALLPSKEPVDISDLLDQGKGVLADVDSSIKNVNGELTTIGGKLDTALGGVTTTVSNVNDIVVGLKHGRGTAGMLLQDETLPTQIRQTLANTQQATADLSHISGQARELIADVQSRGFPQKIDETMSHVNNMASNLDTSTGQLGQVIADFVEPDNGGVSAGANLRDSLSNSNAATANMADETEALKHNFLLRGFFRHRGYYNLADISPDKYRLDPFFTRPTNLRVWLSAAELFERGSTTAEELSPGGRKLLERALDQAGDLVVESPIVVEGYSNGDGPGNQISVSHARAILVRKYLQTHFQIESNHIGAVPMRSLPPGGVGHSDWDGICVVVLRR
jgi:phospholipid/cholesterol/gamma-HCH transport system substrate-binding protein